MDLAPTDDQDALVDSFRELFTKHASVEKVRRAEPLGHDAALWEVLLGVGIVDMAVPESDGGWGASLLDLALVAEEVGAALAPAPVIESQVAARLIGRSVDHLVTLAVHPVAENAATLVPAGAIADDAVMLVGDRLGLVRITDGNRSGVTNLASAPLADVVANVGTELLRGHGAVARFEKAIDEWLTLTAAALVGMAEVVHRMVCAYANERKTWGKFIGAYQAVSHPLADARCAIDGARLLVRKAAWSEDRELAAMAFAFASETARDMTYHAVHFHGGYGFTLEHDAQLYYRRARGWPRVWGDATAAYRRVGDARYERA